MPLFTPTNQKRLTNVAVVRLKKNGKRFEIACYPNKVSAWREKLEKDLDEVLQARQVFTNVSKGEGAKKEDMAKVFGTENVDKICIEILEKGELQVSAKEREEQLDSQFKEIASIVASKCINPVTKKPYTVTSIEQAMKDCHIALRPNRNAKQQALEAIRKLKDNGIKIQRARMRVAVAVSKRQMVEKLRPLAFKIESESFDEETHVTSLTMLCEPADYRTIDEIICKSAASDKGHHIVAKLEIVDLQVPLDEEEEEEQHDEDQHGHPHGKSHHHPHRHGKHDEEEGEEEHSKKGQRKKSGKKLSENHPSEEQQQRGHRKHQQLEPVETEDPVEQAEKAQLEEDQSYRRGRRGKFADISADD